MSSYTNTFGESDDLYRGVVEYTRQQYEYQVDPQFPAGPRIKVKTGPDVVERYCIGPYFTKAPIKSYITRNRRGYKSDLRLVRIDKVTGWESADEV